MMGSGSGSEEMAAAKPLMQPAKKTATSAEAVLVVTIGIEGERKVSVNDNVIFLYLHSLST
jgi:hypothetical protein